MNANVTNLETLLDSKKSKDTAKVSITIRNEKFETLISQNISLNEFRGGIKTFAKIVNNITLRWYEESLTITVNSVEFKFLGGKFAPNVRKLINCYLDSQTLFKTENVTEIRKELRVNVYNFLDSKCNNILQVVELIKFIEKTPVKLLANAVVNTNFLIGSNE